MPTIDKKEIRSDIFAEEAHSLWVSLDDSPNLKRRYFRSGSSNGFSAVTLCRTHT